MTVNSLSLAAEPRELSLVSALDELLERVVSAFSAAGVQLPERRFWSVGEQPVDCEQLVISLSRTYTGTPGDEATTPQQCNNSVTAEVTVAVWRCIPTPTGRRTPSPREMSSAWKQLTIDGWVMQDAAAQNAFDLWGGSGTVSTLEFSNAQGGYQAAVMTLEFAVP